MKASQITAGDTLVRYHESFTGVVDRTDRPVVESTEAYGSHYRKITLVTGEKLTLQNDADVQVAK